MSSDQTQTTADWRPIDEEPIANTVFDVVAKYYDPSLDRFLLQRFANCIQVNDVVFWANPFDKFHTQDRTPPIRLTDHGFRPTHWMPSPEGPKGETNEQ